MIENNMSLGNHQRGPFTLVQDIHNPLYTRRLWYSQISENLKGDNTKEKQTLDIHKCAELNLAGIMILTVDRCRTENKVEQGTVVDSLNLFPSPFMDRGTSVSAGVSGEGSGEAWYASERMSEEHIGLENEWRALEEPGTEDGEERNLSLGT